mmetsp:Transcript_50491/g.134267  ORF Transcript_50491/g.134267 Transcript_50491/m.134267 type:complete len:203 (+) Transcript_50491:463-1071(+)
MVGSSMIAQLKWCLRTRAAQMHALTAQARIGRGQNASALNGSAAPSAPSTAIASAPIERSARRGQRGQSEVAADGGSAALSEAAKHNLLVAAAASARRTVSAAALDAQGTPTNAKHLLLLGAVVSAARTSARVVLHGEPDGRSARGCRRSTDSLAGKSVLGRRSSKLLRSLCSSGGKVVSTLNVFMHQGARKVRLLLSVTFG